MMGRPKGNYKYGEQGIHTTFRLTETCRQWINTHGGRDYLEDLVPTWFREESLQKEKGDKND